MNKIITVVCAVMASLSLTAQTVNSPLSAKDLKAQQAKELKAFKEDIDAFISYANENDLNVELVASFTPDDGFQKYAYITYETGESETEMKIAVF